MCLSIHVYVCKCVYVYMYVYIHYMHPHHFPIYHCRHKYSSTLDLWSCSEWHPKRYRPPTRCWKNPTVFETPFPDPQIASGERFPTPDVVSRLTVTETGWVHPPNRQKKWNKEIFERGEKPSIVSHEIHPSTRYDVPHTLKPLVSYPIASPQVSSFPLLFPPLRPA
jgi:hypothetical protein